MTELQSRTLEVFKYTIKFLKQHNLRYIACGGTVLGAVRHHGFIPWDDDIDICMPRADYEKLLILKDELKKDGHDIYSINTDLNYYLPFAKLVDLTTTLWATPYFPFVTGVFVDIFPLDCFDKNNEEITNIQRRGWKVFLNYKRSIVSGGLLDIPKYITQKKYGIAYRIIRNKILPASSHSKLKAFLDFEKEHSGTCGDKCVFVFSDYIGKITKTSMYTNTIEIPFEDTSVLIPKDYDEYLSLLYGDWRTPPPKEIQQRATHDYCTYYLNLRERLTLEQVKERIKQQEFFVL